MKYENELATIAVDIAYNIHKTLGPGLLESVYEAAFCYELTKRDVPFTRQQEIIVSYDGKQLDVGFRADIIIDDTLLMELKSIENLEKKHHKVVLTYLKLANLS